MGTLILQIDAGGKVYRALSEDHVTEICAWLRRVGVDPDTTHSVRIVDEGRIAVWTCDAFHPAPNSPHILKCVGRDNWTEVSIDEPPPEAWPLFANAEDL